MFGDAEEDFTWEEYLRRAGGHFRTIRDDIKLVRVGERMQRTEGDTRG